MVLLDARPDYDEACSLDVVMDGISSYILAQQVEPCSYPRPLHAQERRASAAYTLSPYVKAPCRQAESQRGGLARSPAKRSTIATAT